MKLMNQSNQSERSKVSPWKPAFDFVTFSLIFDKLCFLSLLTKIEENDGEMTVHETLCINLKFRVKSKVDGHWSMWTVYELKLNGLRDGNQIRRLWNQKVDDRITVNVRITVHFHPFGPSTLTWLKYSTMPVQLKYIYLQKALSANKSKQTYS